MGSGPRRVMVRLAGLSVVTAGLWATASCGSTTQAPPPGPPLAVSGAVAAPAPSSVCSGFALSVVSDRGGQPSPVAAAEWFAVHGGDAGLPRSGWHEEGSDASGTTVRSGAVTLHVVRGPDGTWQVDSGSGC